MQVRVRPAFITFLGFWFALLCVAGLVIPAWLFLGHADTYSLNGAPATRQEFIAYLKPLLPGFAALAILGGVTSWTILTERLLGRPLAIALLMLLVAGPVVMPTSGGPPLSVVWPFALVIAVLIGLPLLWYFYRKRNVVEYYGELGQD